jgi:hypothetical protein
VTATLPLGELGTLHADFVLDEEAALGYYALNAYIPIAQSGEGRKFLYTYGQTFLVSEYRRPEFVVDVTPAKDEYVAGEAIQFGVQAAYFFGGAVSGGKVTDRAIERLRRSLPRPRLLNCATATTWPRQAATSSRRARVRRQRQLVVELPANSTRRRQSDVHSRGDGHRH